MRGVRRFSVVWPSWSHESQELTLSAYDPEAHPSCGLGERGGLTLLKDPLKWELSSSSFRVVVSSSRPLVIVDGLACSHTPDAPPGTWKFLRPQAAPTTE